MVRVVLRRLLACIPVLFVVLFFVFLLIHLTPGDPATIVAGDYASPTQIQTVRHELGLDKPAPEQFVSFIGHVATGNLGTSVFSDRPVTGLISQSLPITLSLTLVAMILAVIIGVSFGLIAALTTGGLIDRAISAVSALFLAVPSFVVGFLLVIPLAVQRRLLPATGYEPLSHGVGEWLKYLILPGFALSLTLAAEIARQVRGAMADTLEQDFIRTKRASGLTPLSVIGKHALRNSAIPVVTVIGLQAGRLLAGVVVVEAIFNMPGLGSLAYMSVVNRDLPTVQGVVLVSALGIVLVNLVVDLACMALNPKLRS